MVSKPKKIIAVTVCSVILAIVLALNIGVAVMAPSIDKFIIGFKPSKDSAASRGIGRTNPSGRYRPRAKQRQRFAAK